MKVLSAQAIRDWDQYTITLEPISPLDLMERAAGKCAEWLMEQYPDAPFFSIFCGKGNNGGDGLVIARLLLENNYRVSVFILEFGHKGTEEFQSNLARLHKMPGAAIHFIQDEAHFHPLSPGTIIIDALLGSGINRYLDGLTAKLVVYINASACIIIAIDIPSGLFADTSTRGQLTIRAAHTLTFQCMKTAFLVAENEAAIGQVQVLDIGLHPGFLPSPAGNYELTDDELIHAIYRPRTRFSHKGDFGNILLAGGSYGKMGAAVLMAHACLRGGAGLVTCHIPRSGYTILQTAVPEAMVMTDPDEDILTALSVDTAGLSRYDAIGIGPGMGTAEASIHVLHQLMKNYSKPMVVDADALNGMARQPQLLKDLPPGSILTPHPKEFERLWGATDNAFNQIALALEKAKELKAVIILKGHHTFIATPGGQGYFNGTGNAGMATGGSGDVLTGLLTALLGQGYPSEQAAVLGVYLHGMAGDLAAAQSSQESLIAGDILACFGQAFSQIAGLSG
ncbi:MAG: NAD(P)H-hydrate dehydratase [Bacteroidetes bacterium]|nr:NAD(P)H-hydrate dehydratase [Bacteroidota bacterium]